MSDELALQILGGLDPAIALWKASQEGYVEIVKLLLKACGVDSTLLDS